MMRISLGVRALVAVFSLNLAPEVSSLLPSGRCVENRRKTGQFRGWERQTGLRCRQTEHAEIPSRREALAVITLASLTPLRVLAEEPSTVEKSEPLVWSPLGSGKTLRNVKVRKPERERYPVRFVTYLTRFLLNFDRDVQSWWLTQSQDVPEFISLQDIQRLKQKRFQELAETVELGLRDYSGEKGETALLSLMRSRYGRTYDGKRQLAILFTFLEGNNQPVGPISRLIAAADNASVVDLRISDGGSGYDSSLPLPNVTISAPLAGTSTFFWEAGDSQAKAEVTSLKPTGALLALKILEGGSDYDDAYKPVTVTISPPNDPKGRRATAKVRVENGVVTELELTDPGEGYAADDYVLVEISSEGFYTEAASAEAVLDYQVQEIKLINNGFGYGGTQAIVVGIAPPLATNCNASQPGMCREAKAYPVLFFRSSNSEKQRRGDFWTPIPLIPSDFSALLPSSTIPLFDVSINEYIISEVAFKSAGKLSRNDPIFGNLGTSPVLREVPLKTIDYVKFAAAGGVCTAFIRTALSPLELIKTQLQLNPPAPGSEEEAVDGEKPKPGWQVCADDLIASYEEGLLLQQQSSSDTIAAEGALPTPDVTLDAFAQLRRLAPLFRGADASGAGGLLLGAISFGQVEYFRRGLSTLVGQAEADLYQLPLLLIASIAAVTVTCIFVCPFETARLRLMTTAMTSANDTVSNLPEAFSEMVGKQDGGGLGELWRGLGPLLYREMLFSIPKFLVFNWGVSFLSVMLGKTLFVSLISGALAGVAGAIVSSPADAAFTKQGNTGGDEPSEGSEGEGGAESDDPMANALAGVGVRCIFFASSIAVQFLLYDSAKILLGVSSTDITEGLDVFADRLSFYT